MKAHALLVFIGLLLVVGACEAKHKKKFDGDFEFAEEEESAKTGGGGSTVKKRWIHDPNSDLCRPLNCKKKETCLLEDPFTAVCVSKKELQKNGDVVIPKSKVSLLRQQDDDESNNDDVFYDTEDDPEDEIDEDMSDTSLCKTCPVIKPMFLCGSDNRTYSSLCRLDYHNCIHHTSIRVLCKGFCPCRGGADADEYIRKKQHQQERLSSILNKYKATLDKTGAMSSAAARKSDVYTFTPQDFKYENKHYKYIKYTKGDNALNAADKEHVRGYNDVVVDERPASKPCATSALQAMGNRLLDWFSVVMADAARRRRTNRKSKARFPAVCKAEVRWMFQHLDLNADGRLAPQELFDLEHDASEVCLKPFLQQCDVDHDGVVSASEWCKCFQRTERPCTAVKRKVTPDLLGVYVPDCDAQGYYRLTQCHTAVGMCWCVDKHGVEFANTRTHGKATCESLPSTHAVDDDNDDDDDDGGEQDIEGSADRAEDY